MRCRAGLPLPRAARALTNLTRSLARPSRARASTVFGEDRRRAGPKGRAPASWGNPTIGLTRAELDQAQSASVGESVALEALGTLTGADKAVTDAVPIIDELRFGSAYSSRTGRTEPTITIGKRLAERIRANVTSGVAESREIRSNVEWQLSPRVSVEGSYDNVNDISSSSLGNLGADVRWRMEFE